MEYLPLILVSVAVLILGGVGAVYMQHERVKRRVVGRAKELLRGGVTSEETTQQLLGEGLTAEQAAAVVALAQRRLLVDEAVEWFLAGKTEDEVLPALEAKGLDQDTALQITGTASFTAFCRRHPWLTPVLGVTFVLVGLAVMGGGIFLWMGNRSGKFVTFPFAGQLVMIVGLMLFAFGGSFVVRTLSG
jgi:hypothetical protein